MRVEDLTEKDRALIRGMNYRAKTGAFVGYGVPEYRPSNIAALYFDGQVLIDMVHAHRELERRKTAT